MSFFLLLVLLKIITFSDSTNSYDNLDNFISDFENVAYKTKLISCVNLIKTYLSQRDGDQVLKRLIQRTNQPKNKTYIKQIISKINSCVKNINKEQIQFLLTPENIDNYNTLNNSITKLIKNQNEITNVELTKEEQKIFDTISSNFQFNDNIKKKKNKFLKFISNNKIGLIFSSVIIGIISFICFKLIVGKDANKEKKEKKIKKKKRN